MTGQAISKPRSRGGGPRTGTELDRAIRSEKVPEARERLRAVRGVRQLGYSVAEMARYCDVAERTVREWLGRFDEEGPGGASNMPRRGRPPARKPRAETPQID